MNCALYMDILLVNWMSGSICSSFDFVEARMSTGVGGRHSDILVYTCSFKYVTWWREWAGCREYWFWDTGSKRWQILIFYIVFKLQRMFIISATRCPIEMGFESKCSILNAQMIYIKIKNWILPTCDSFPLIPSHILPKEVLTFSKKTGVSSCFTPDLTS